MGSPILRYRHLILLHTQMRDGCRCQLTVREWPADFGPYALGYQPRSSEHRVSIRSSQKPKPLCTSELVEEKNTRATTKKKPAVAKYRSVSVIQDFPPTPWRFNPHLSEERKQAIHTHLTQILDEYA
jgi:hypothetical protein